MSRKAIRIRMIMFGMKSKYLEQTTKKLMESDIKYYVTKNYEIVAFSKYDQIEYLESLGFKQVNEDFY